MCLILQDRCWIVYVQFVHMIKFKFLAQFPVDHFAHIIITTLLEFFTSALADGFSLEFEWQQVSSSFQDSSQYSGRFQ